MRHVYIFGSLRNNFRRLDWFLVVFRSGCICSLFHIFGFSCPHVASAMCSSLGAMGSWLIWNHFFIRVFHHWRSSVMLSVCTPPSFLSGRCLFALSCRIGVAYSEIRRTFAPPGAFCRFPPICLYFSIRPLFACICVIVLCSCSLLFTIFRLRRSVSRYCCLSVVVYSRRLVFFASGLLSVVSPRSISELCIVFGDAFPGCILLVFYFCFVVLMCLVFLVGGVFSSCCVLCLSLPPCYAFG